MDTTGTVDYTNYTNEGLVATLLALHQRAIEKTNDHDAYHQHRDEMTRVEAEILGRMS